MTKEDKDLLLQYLCMALPYSVKCQTKNGIGTLISVKCSFGKKLVYVDFGRSEAEEYDLNDGDTVKPYLRSMSSMTEEELTQYKCMNDALDENYEVHIDNAYPAFDLLNAHHFDYRGLIEKSLAIVAPDNMYKTK